jgi:hypothetical protein
MASPSLIIEHRTDNKDSKEKDGYSLEKLHSVCEEASQFLLEEDWVELTPQDCNVDDLDALGRAALAKRVLKRMGERCSETSVCKSAIGGESDTPYDESLSDAEEEEEDVERPKKSEKQSEMSLADVVEPLIIVYSGCAFGVPEEAILLRGVPMAFDSAELMSKTLISKAPTAWNGFLTKHITVVQATVRHKPEGWYPGKDGQQESDLDFECFFYVSAYVTPDPDDAEAVRRAEYDKRRLHHVFKCVTVKMVDRFNKLTRITDERKKAIAPVLNWVEPRNPQVKPEVANWPRYDKLKLYSDFSRPGSTPRVKGSQKSRTKRMDGPTLKRAVDESSTSSAAATEQVVEEEVELGFVAQSAGLKRLRKISVGAKAHSWVQDGHVWIAEHH